MAKLTIAQRLKAFRIDIGTASPADLEVPANQQVVLDPADAKFKPNLRYLEPKSLDEVKAWLGNPDEAIARTDVGIRTVASIRNIVPSRTAAAATLPSTILPNRPVFAPQELDDLHVLASAYVYGHSASVDPRQLPALNGWLERLKIRIPILLFKDIHVATGATLQINTPTLFANHITVEKGGRIKLAITKGVIHAAGFTGKK